MALKVSSGDLDDDEANSVLDAAQPARDAGIKVSAGGYLGQQLSSPSTGLSEIIGVLGALIILLFAFRTFVAAPLPVTTAIVALACGLAVVGLAGHAIDVPSIAPTLGIMLGLAVGTDYSLFIISRHLRFLQEGIEPDESIARSVGTSGSAVVFAGCTVIIALLCLYFSGIPLVRSLGYTTAMVVAAAVLAAITFLPAILALLGRRILKLPFRFGERKRDAGHPGGWFKWAGTIRNHPLIAAVVGIVFLGLIALPALDLRLGAEDYSQLPTDTTDRQAYDALTKGFGAGTNGPLLIAVKNDGKPFASDPSQVASIQQQQAALQQQVAAEGGTPTPQQQTQEQQLGQQLQIAETPAGDPRLVNLQQEISKQDNVQSVTPAATDKSGNAAVFSTTPKTSPSAYATQDLVNHLRDKTIPDATQGTSLTAYVGGTTASYIDLATKISDKLFLVIGIVVVFSFLLLTLAFRTVLVPLDLGADQPAGGRGLIRGPDRGLREGVRAVFDRRGPRDAGGQLRAADDVRDPLRPLDGLSGVPGLADCRAPSGRRGQQRGSESGAGERRPGDRRRRDDHVRCLLQLRAQRRPGRQAVRDRAGGVGGDRRARRAADHARRARADRGAELVPAALG